MRRLDLVLATLRPLVEAANGVPGDASRDASRIIRRAYRGPMGKHGRKFTARERARAAQRWRQRYRRMAAARAYAEELRRRRAAHP